ncbi:ankyrin repeat domain-containing protein 24 isoform X2 [Falco cherrug]|uniref:ankyrin repeat domain-containing protein 24 isoform X2 n=1 Tax=Falco cherrug TaxID=345164 RepID=UPI002478D8D1|nr:ankyrin repeat domain-containing protein 24 isoform X2 [Falco cherrug]
MAPCLPAPGCWRGASSPLPRWGLCVCVCVSRAPPRLPSAASCNRSRNPTPAAPPRWALRQPPGHWSSRAGGAWAWSSGGETLEHSHPPSRCHGAGAAMKSLKAKFKKADSQDWTKNDEKLLQAVDYNDAGRVTSLLVRKGLVPTKLDSEGKSAFHLAAMRGNVDCLEAMLAHGVDAMTKDSSGYTALHLASKHGHPQCVSKLLQASCPVDVADGSGRTALHHAAVSGCISCSEILCDFKAPLNIKDKDGSTPLILAAKMSHSELCRYLLHRGAAVNSQDLQGRTALMLACENGSVETVEVLVNAGARVAVVDSTGHDATHYSLATGNALIQHFLQEAAQRRSWASEEESAEQTSQTSSPSQSSVREKNSTPRKRKAPLPPLGIPGQEDRDAYEEIVRLRQERAQFLQKIRGLEQQEKQRREAELDEGSLRSMEKQIQQLEERLAVRDREKERLGKEVEALQSRLSSLENERENTSYDIETLQDEEGDPLEFPGAELLLSKKTLSPSAEELLATLQGQVQSLTMQNKELREKIQVLENYERDESSPSTLGDVVPASLYKALQRELEQLRAQRLEVPQGTDTREDTAGGQPAAWSGASEHVMEGSAVQRLAKEPAWSRDESKAAPGELRAHTEASSAAEQEVGTELAETRAALLQAQEALEEREQRVKELQTHLEASVESVEATASLEEAAREREALLERCGRAEAEAEALRRELEAKARDWRAAGGPMPEPGVLERRVADLVRQHEEVTAQLGQLRETLGRREAELGVLREQLAARPVGRQEHEEALARLRQAQSEGWVPRDEHARATAALEEQARALRERAAQLEAAAEAKGRRAARLEAELAAAVPRGEHEAAQAGLQAEAAALAQKLGELSRRHEKTCEEVFRVQRQALFMKSERQAAEDRLAAVQKQLAEAQDEARRLRELHSQAEDSARLVKDRDRKITELSKEVFRLKEALNALPEARGPPQPPLNTALLQDRIRALEEKLVETEKRHSKVVKLYRSHLLYAVQGHMDEDVQKLLCQILRMQQLQEQGR